MAVSLVGALIVVVTLSSEKAAAQARAQLGHVDMESFRIADRFKDKLRFANDKMRRYAGSDDHAAWDEFLQASQELKQWLDGQRFRLSTDHELQLLRQLDEAHGVYVQKAQDLHARMEASREGSASLAQYNGFFEQSRRVLDLGQELARAHFESRNEMLARASHTLSELRMFVLGLVGLLFLFALALAAVVYRDLIAPLRVRLVASEAIAERREKLASLGLLAAGVAHEIRNPLTAIKTALFLQRKKLQPGAAEQADVELVEGEIVRLERIVNQFLSFARPAQPELAATTAEEILQDVHSLLGPTLAKADIALVREESGPLRVRVDASQIKQVLINLVQNASDSIGRSGTITLRARADRTRSANGDNGVVVLEVADTGKGITPEVEKRLFDPFFTTKDQGTGLGLSIAARIVQMNGGALQYQTQVNRGSTFGIVLPQISH